MSHPHAKCCDTGPRFLRPRPKDRSNSVALYEKQGVLRTDSDPGPHGIKEE